MGREVRRVAKDWQHPQRGEGPDHFKPLFGGDYQTEAEAWMERMRKWESGKDPDRAIAAAKYGTRYFWDWDGGPPNKDSFMFQTPPDPASLTHLMLYETTTEGTPLSPAFKTLEEVAAWAAENDASIFAHSRATKEKWLKILRAPPPSSAE